jgi:hypothetical protein
VEKIYTRDEAISYLRLDAVPGNAVKALYNLVQSGRLGHLRYHGRLYFRQAHLDQFLDQSETKDLATRLAEKK